MLWIDVVNEPQVRLWRRFLRRHRIDALVTVRRKGSLVKLAERFLPKYVVVGRWARSRGDKLKAFAERVRDLALLLDDYDVTLATSKGSPEQARVAFGLGIPLIALNDNDLSPHIVTKLTFPLSKLAVVPECFSGPTYGPTLRFEGVFEVAHVLDYLENPTQVEYKRLGLEKRGYIVVRPPPVGSHYLSRADHFDDAVRRLLKSKGLEEVRFPREGGIILPGGRFDDVVDGLDLMATSAGVISGGGTMIREAALLGVPAISLFPRPDPCVTGVLMREGLIAKVNSDTIIDSYERMREEMLSGELAERARKFLRGVEDPADVIARAIDEVLQEGS